MSIPTNYAAFLISCQDRKGIVAAVSGFFSERGVNIVHCQQYTEPLERLFFMRILVDLDSSALSLSQLTAEFALCAEKLSMRWTHHCCADPIRVGVMVTREPHCLLDLLTRAHTGDMPNAQIVVVISNRPELEAAARQFGVPFRHCAVSATNDLPGNSPAKTAARRAQEREITELLRQHQAQLVVLARYMQILSAEMLDEMAMPAINIHHAFLPAFQGAAPYRRAWERGVKMIGATAHYVTPALDDGPIIEQDVERVSHEESIDQLQRTGRDIERMVLARAVRAHIEHRVIVHANRTVVFSRGH